MITNCPHCKKSLQLSPAHQAKIQKALQELQPGKRLTIKCPHCMQGIGLENNERVKRESPSLEREQRQEIAYPSGIQPPPPPNLDWLKDENYREDDADEDVPMALVLYPDNNNRKRVIESLETVGYRVLCNDTAMEAVERMSFINFACIVVHSRFEGRELDESGFHEYMKNLNMQQRRYIFYIMIGPEFHTLYNMEAMAHSSNLVVNEGDLKYLDVILRQSIPAHETLFGAIMEEMAAYGKK